MNPAVTSACARGFGEPIRDPVWGHVFFDRALKAIVDSGPFFKLSRVRQLGPAHLVYPGATHTRYAHSLGVYHLARKLLLALSERFPLGFVSETGARSFLVACLCHDLGHFPYAHSLKELPLKEHETLTAELLLASPLDALAREAGADARFAAAIADRAFDCPGADPTELRFYRRMLSGVLDPDKMDYLNRDALACGVPYGTQDVEFAYRHLVVDAKGELSCDSRGAMAIEAVLFSKYLMYRSVYWNRSVRAATSMVKKAVRAGLANGAFPADALYGLDDPGFERLMESMDYPEAAIARDVFRGRTWPACLESPFDPGSRAHAALEPLEARTRAEAELSEAIGGMPVVLDIPERIGFESDMRILEESGDRAFSESGTVFSRGVVEGFVRSIRVLRVFLPVEADAGLLGAIRERVAP